MVMYMSTVMMMMIRMSLELLFIALLMIRASTDYAAEGAEPLRTFMVHAPEKGMPGFFASRKAWHSSLLSSVLKGGASPDDRVLYWYDTVMQGFAAGLSPQEAEVLRARQGVATVTADRLTRLHTTRSPSFLGLAAFPEQVRSMGALWPASHRGADVIVGLIDTGIWPERSSFRDDGFSPVPRRWRGTCQSSPSDSSPVVCNRKLVGARAFFKGYEAHYGGINDTEDFRSPRDAHGHGTHTASTAVGCPVYNASLFGLAEGTAIGVAPAARLAIYKACWSAGGTCSEADVLSAFEAALYDGVDIISVSLAFAMPGESSYYATDTIAVGALAAAGKGILTVASAGNSGPVPKFVFNVAPWILTVAAASLDRSFPAPVVLGDGQRYGGFSLYRGAGLGGRQFPLIYAFHAALHRAAAVRTNNLIATTNASLCLPGFLDPKLVRGKIVLCDISLSSLEEKEFVVQEAGGVGLLVGDVLGDLSWSFTLPAAVIGIPETEAIKQYIDSSPNATATLLFPGTQWHVQLAPTVAVFSSRGPNNATPEILKPDIAAPGLNILAAWTGFVGPSGVAADERRVEFNIGSGTSMSCPHVAGVAALLKAAHPGWSPAAIKSAMMTTAVVRDRTGGPLLDEFMMGPADATAYGVGHVHPNAAMEPGLLYDVRPEDYVDFLSGVSDGDTSSNSNNTLRPGDLNYPSFSPVYRYDILDPAPFSSTLSRALTNVSPSPLPATYNVSVVPPPNVNISVTPTSLRFSALAETLSYSITFTALPLPASALYDVEHYEFGSLSWSDGYHNVRSPIMFTWVQQI